MSLRNELNRNHTNESDDDDVTNDNDTVEATINYDSGIDTENDSNAEYGDYGLSLRRGVIDASQIGNFDNEDDFDFMREILNRHEESIIEICDIKLATIHHVRRWGELLHENQHVQKIILHLSDF
jgi:hypothetical protein